MMILWAWVGTLPMNSEDDQIAFDSEMRGAAISIDPNIRQLLNKNCFRERLS
jgi:hypothetical protein